MTEMTEKDAQALIARIKSRIAYVNLQLELARERQDKEFLNELACLLCEADHAQASESRSDQG